VPPTVTATPQKPVIPDLTGMFEEARSAMIKGDYLGAITGFENVLKVDPNFPNAANLLDVARGGARNASQLAVDAGNKAEMTADYLGAMKQYERALQLDEKSTSAPEAIRRLKVRMQREGEAAFASAKQYDAGDRAKEAIAAYERALQLLPTEHASVSTARDRLAALKR
jgi:tetratricopeptide (TPR) repeat protein